MDFGLQGKVAFVSGSSKGMGKAVATIFAEEGAKVVVTGRNRETLQAAAEEIRQSSGNPDVIGVSVDLTMRDGVHQAVSQVAEKWGTIDIAVSNVDGPESMGFESVSDEDWQQAYQQQVMHVVYVTSEVLPYMKKKRWGRLININALCAKEPHRELPLITANAVRPAVIGIQKSLASEIAEYGITVNTVLPGSFATGKHKEFARRRVEEMGIDVEKVPVGKLENIPMRRLGDPREIGAVVVFLASEQASFVTGVSIQVDGGRLRSLF